MVRKLLPLALLPALSLSCVDEIETIDRYEQPIINGEACSKEELPETVALIVDASVDFGGDSFPIRALMCTGTLIAPDTILTAAHCLDPAALTGGFGTVEEATFYISSTSDLSDLAGQSQSLPDLPTDALPVRSVVRHEDFRLDEENLPEGLSNFYDIGLMFLESPIDTIEPAIVMTPEEAAQLEVGDEVRIAGWGQQTPDRGGPVGTKHCASTAIYELGDFEMQIGNEPTTSRKCHGDSGGPTFISIETDTLRKERVIGATSRAYDSSDCQKGGVDTMASAWYEWIDAQMSEGCDSGQRAWCEVSGVVAPDYYDDPNGGDPNDPEDPNAGSEDGGCSTGGSNASGFGLLLLAAMLLRRRRS
jgi:uncharacterized protein (TIGR03382 family)